MCTLTYLPARHSYLLTSSRDESTQRAKAVFPVYKNIGLNTVLMPQDPEGGGTWMATDNHGDTACLMNGAFENHQRQPPYRKSRGLIVLDSFQFSEVKEFAAIFEFEGIEPFTLIKVARHNIPVLHEIIWDGKKVYHQQLSALQPHIWSSVTLYDHAARQKRREWFRQWLAKKPDFTPGNIMRFHLYGGEGNAQVDFKMKRSEMLQTLSLSCIEVKKSTTHFIYQDFMYDLIKEEVIQHSPLSA